eukprot:scaffold79201_cov51-Phaeocystis_antarctica.AAC.3
MSIRNSRCTGSKSLNFLWSRGSAVNTAPMSILSCAQNATRCSRRGTITGACLGGGVGGRAHLPEGIGGIVAEIADVDVVAGGEGELAPAQQVVRGGLLVLRAVAQPFAHELRREDAVVVPAMGNRRSSPRRWAARCGALQRTGGGAPARTPAAGRRWA